MNEGFSFPWSEMDWNHIGRKYRLQKATTWAGKKIYQEVVFSFTRLPGKTKISLLLHSSNHGSETLGPIAKMDIKQELVKNSF